MSVRPGAPGNRRTTKARLLGASLSVLAVLAVACGDDAAVDESVVHDESVHLNDIQVLGTHNSYKQRIDDDLFGLLEQFDAGLAATLDYEHRPITEQLGELGARQLELDVFADPDGGRFASRAAYELVGRPVEVDDPALQEPGFKVLHVQEVDYASSCPTLVACLTEVRDWSDANPDHLPILLLVEVKDDEIPDPLDLGFVQPPQIDAADLDDLDEEIRSVFDLDHLITPDDVRGDHETLREAVLADGWPTLAEARGRIVFALDNTNHVLDAYLDRAAGLEGQLLFASVDTDHPAAAFVKLNDPIVDGERIQDLVGQGFVVRTRADADTMQARDGDTTMSEAALASGAQYVSTDYLEPDDRLSDYAVELPGGAPARCNPVRSSESCDPELLAG